MSTKELNSLFDYCKLNGLEDILEQFDVEKNAPNTVNNTLFESHSSGVE